MALPVPPKASTPGRDEHGQNRDDLCEIRWGFLDFQSQDDSDGGDRRPLS